MRNSEFQFVNNDTAALQQSMIAMYEQITGFTVQPASPEKLFISWVTSVLVQTYALMNYVGNQNIPSRADGKNLDALGELFYAVERPQAHAAICTEQFMISEAQRFDIIVPAGTRVTDASRALIWETIADATIPAGATSVSVGLRCQTAGAVGNGYVAGQLNTIVDVFPYYSGCSNLTVSDGGSDEATDDEYYDLLKASQDAYSTAGPSGAYVYHAKSVSTEISDVKVVRPRRMINAELTVYDGHAFLCGVNVSLESLQVSGGILGKDYTADNSDGLIVISLDSQGALAAAKTIQVQAIADDAGCVDIYALMNDGLPASPTIKDMILAACNDEAVRPLTDKVNVKDLSIVSYDINVTYYTSEESVSSPSAVTAAVNAAIAEYKTWQSSRIGRDINPSKLISCLMGTGLLKRVVVNAPEFMPLKDGSDHATPQIAIVSTTTITNGGVEDD